MILNAYAIEQLNFIGMSLYIKFAKIFCTVEVRLSMINIWKIL